MRIVGLITARGGSKGLPHKNILSLAGKPLITWTVEAALNCKSINRLIVSTDDYEIADVARQAGAEVPFMRPAELAQDGSDHLSVVSHAIQWLDHHDSAKADYVLLLQPTSPLRSTSDLNTAITMATQQDAVAVVSVSLMNQHPYYAQVIQNDGTLAEFMSTDQAYSQRQELPQVYAPNGAIYLNKRESLLQDRTFVPRKTLAYVMPPERSLDIDTAWDFYLADLILKDKYAHKSN